MAELGYHSGSVNKVANYRNGNDTDRRSPSGAVNVACRKPTDCESNRLD